MTGFTPSSSKGNNIISRAGADGEKRPSAAAVSLSQLEVDASLHSAAPGVRTREIIPVRAKAFHAKAQRKLSNYFPFFAPWRLGVRLFIF
jgi:hypothetical protein